MKSSVGVALETIFFLEKKNCFELNLHAFMYLHHQKEVFLQVGQRRQFTKITNIGGRKKQLVCKDREDGKKKKCMCSIFYSFSFVPGML